MQEVKPVQIKKDCNPFGIKWFYKKVFHIIDEILLKRLGVSVFEQLLKEWLLDKEVRVFFQHSFDEEFFDFCF